MALSKAKQLELLYIFAYLDAVSSSPVEDHIPFVMEHYSVTKKNAYSALEVFQSLIPLMEAAQERCEDQLEAYRFERLGTVEQAIVRLCGGLMLQSPQEAPGIVMQGVRLAHRYATPAASALIHALLAGLLPQKQAQEAPSVQESLLMLEEADAHVQSIEPVPHPAPGSSESL